MEKEYTQLNVIRLYEHCQRSLTNKKATKVLQRGGVDITRLVKAGDGGVDWASPDPREVRKEYKGWIEVYSLTDPEVAAVFFAQNPKENDEYLINLVRAVVIGRRKSITDLERKAGFSYLT